MRLLQGASVVATLQLLPTEMLTKLQCPQCNVTWSRGELVTINWLNPPSSSSVYVAFGSNDEGGAYYSIADSVPSSDSSGSCNAGQGYGVAVEGQECGVVRFVIPLEWELGTNCTSRRPRYPSAPPPLIGAVHVNVQTRSLSAPMMLLATLATPMLCV